MLHITNGDSTAGTLRQTGLEGEVIPWRDVLHEMVPDEQTVFTYQPPRWVEYGMQFYRFNRTQDIWNADELRMVIPKGEKKLFVSDEKGLVELGSVPGVEIKIEKAVGNLSVFWLSLAP